MSEEKHVTLHASSVSLAGNAVLIMGPSGSGKSGLALDLISRGGALVADDRTRVTLEDGQLMASAPESIFGKIEARGIGILAGAAVKQARVILAVDLGETEPNRLPAPRKTTILRAEIDLIHGAGVPNLAAALHFYLKGSRHT